LLEDGAESGAIVDCGFGFDADFVTGCSAAIGPCLALVGDRPERAVLAQAQDLPGFAEGAGGRVVERVLLEGAGGIELKAEAGKARLQTGKIVDGELELDLRALHDKSIRRHG